jgi:hypothetical protein
VFLYATIGGGNCLLGLMGLQYFRGSDRYSTWILAICLFFLVSRMSKIVRGWSRYTSYLLASATAILGLLDQLPSPPPQAEIQALAKVVENDRSFSQKLEADLPPGTMIFQVPVMNFIDADRINECTAYEHLRPYLWTKTLRFSFGSVQGRTREAWQAAIMKLPTEQLVATLEQFGFGALYLDRRAFTDRAEATIKELGRLGKTQLIEDDAHDLVCVRLTPSPNPSFPHSVDAAQIVNKRGWIWPEKTEKGTCLWAGGDATLYFVNEGEVGRNFHLTCKLTTYVSRRVEIEFEGRSIWGAELAPGQIMPVDIRLTAKSGRNHLYFKTDAPPVVPQNSQMVRLSFGLMNLLIFGSSLAQPQ